MSTTQTPPDPAAAAEPGIGGLIKDLRDESILLLKQEMALARTEMTQKAKQAARDTAKIPAGALIAYLGLGLVLVAISLLAGWLLLLTGLDPLASNVIGFAIVGIITLVAGLLIAKTAVDRLGHDDITPEETIRSVKENAEWAKEKTR